MRSCYAAGNYYPDVYNAVWRQLGSYLSSGPPLGLAPNFELALADMITLSNWAKPAPFGSALQPSTSISLPAGTPGVPGSDYTASTHVVGQTIHLLRSLADHMRVLCAALNSNSVAFQSYRSIFSTLHEWFDVGVYNLNYDNVALKARPSAYVGFDESARFDAEEVHTRREWDFIYHLHGSVHHTLQGVFANSMGWQKDLSGSFDDGKIGRSQNNASDGKSMPKTTLIAGGHKLDQLLPEPFQTLYSAFVRHVHEADAVLIGGYGFADVHVNRALRNRFESGKPRAPVVILGFSPDNRDPTKFRRDAWVHNMGQSLVVQDDFLEPGRPSVPNLGALKRGRGFEVARRTKIAIWHSGFVEAEWRIKTICGWLAGVVDDLELAAR